MTGSYTTDVFTIDPITGPIYIYKTMGDEQSVTFTMLDDTDSFSDVRYGLHNGGVSVIHTVSTPLPAALPLFAAGVGIVMFLARRKKTAATRPA